MQLLSLGHSLRELQDPASQECLYSRSAALEKGTHCLGFSHLKLYTCEEVPG